MALPEYVAPVLAAGGPVALVLVILRFGPDAFLRLLAGTVAVLTRDEKRGQRCLDVLRVLRGRDTSPPSPPEAEVAQGEEGYPPPGHRQVHPLPRVAGARAPAYRVGDGLRFRDTEIEERMDQHAA
jgi:hypothetical protein